MKCLRIVDWKVHFETHRTRVLKSLSYVPIPNKHDGEGYSILLDHDRGMLHYAAWVLIVQVASKCKPRGTLLRDSRHPHDAQSLARKTRCDASAFADAIPRLVEIGWLEWVEIDEADLRQMRECAPESGAGAPESGDNRKGPEGNGITGTGARARSGRGVFEELTTAMLGDARALDAWIRHASARCRPIVSKSDEDRLRVFAAAERALECGDNPVALFTSIVSKRQWRLLSAEQEDRANAKLKTLLPPPRRAYATVKGISDD